MARVAVSIEKGVSFWGKEERFANVYHYDLGVAGTVVPGDANALVDALVALEKPVYASVVSFRTARVWETGGTPAENETVLIKDLTGPGTLSSSTQLWAENAVVVNIDTGRNTTTGRKIYLRKYIRCQYLGTSASGQARGETALTTAQKQPFLTYGQSIREISLLGGTVSADLESPGGQDAGASATVTVLDYLHNRQFRWQRRRRA